MPRASRTGGRAAFVGTVLRALAAAAIVAGILGLPVPAHAHTELVRSSPVARSVVPLTTDRLTLVFSDDLVPLASDVAVRDDSDTDVSVAKPATEGSSVVVGLELASPGRHSVAYRVVGSDGHVVSGTWSFTAAAGASREPSEVVAEREETPGVSVRPRWVVAVACLAGALLVLHRRSRRRQPTRAR